MDDIVLRGMARWPDVPAVYGWLALDRRGAWRLKGDVISNPAVTAFIGRNYAHDGEGRWYFQNGPQRVYVALDYTPFVYRTGSRDSRSLSLETHTSRPVHAVRSACMDEDGALLLETEHGIGLLHDHDVLQVFPYLIDANGTALDEAVLESLFDLLEQGREAPLWLRTSDGIVRLAPIQSVEVPRRFGFIAHPDAPASEEVCR